MTLSKLNMDDERGAVLTQSAKGCTHRVPRPPFWLIVTALDRNRYLPVNVWVGYFVWNFKGYLWNSTQNILPIHWKMWILFTAAGENLRALRFKSSSVFLKRPPATIIMFAKQVHDKIRARLFSKSSLARLQEFWNSATCLYRIKKKNLFKSSCPTGSFTCPGLSGSGKRWALCITIQFIEKYHSRKIGS